MPDIMNHIPMTTAQKRMKERLCKENPSLAHKLDFKLTIADPWFLNYSRLRKKENNNV